LQLTAVSPDRRMPRGRKSQDRHNSVAETLPPGYYETQGQWRVVQTGRKQFVGCLDRNHNRRCDSSDTSGELRSTTCSGSSTTPRRPGLSKASASTHYQRHKRFRRCTRRSHRARRPLGHEKILTYQGEIVLNAVDNEPVTSGQGSADGSVVPQARAVGC